MAHLTSLSIPFISFEFVAVWIRSGHVTSRLTIGATKSGVYLIQQLIDKAWGTRAFSATVKGKKMIDAFLHCL